MILESGKQVGRKASWLNQFENLQHYKDLYGKLLERDWRAKRLLLIQILLISNVHKNSPLKRCKPENLHVSLFGTVLSIPDNTMHYQWLISVFLKNTSRDLSLCGVGMTRQNDSSIVFRWSSRVRYIVIVSRNINNSRTILWIKSRNCDVIRDW